MTKSKYKFNPYERAVGFFLTFAIVGSAFIGVGVAVKKNWFEEKISFSTYVQTAANLRVGSSVLMSGLRVGKLEKVDLDGAQKIKVTFSVLKKYGPQMTEGTRVEFVRPFVLGDKALTLLQGPSGGTPLVAGEVLPVQDSLDLLEALSGKKLEGILTKVDSILSNLDQTMAMGKDIAYQVGGNKKLKRTVEDLSFASHEIRKSLPHLTGNATVASAHLAKTIENLSSITTNLKELQPEGTQKTIELLSESVITLKGMQKSFFLRSGVKEVKEEIAQDKKVQENREPASEK